MRKEMFGYEITVLRDTFQRLLRRHAVTNLVKLIEKNHPADIALLFRYLNETEQRELFNLMEANEQTTEFLSELDESILRSLLETEDPTRIADLIRVSSSNDQATILGVLPEEKTQAVMDLLKAEEQEEVEEIMGYPEDSAGSLMSTDVFSLPKDTVAKDAIMALQDHEKAEMVFYLYVTDDEERLVGVISLRDLVTTPPGKTLEEIMVKTVQHRVAGYGSRGSGPLGFPLQLFSCAGGGSGKPPVGNRHRRRRGRYHPGRGHGGLLPDGGNRGRTGSYY